MGAAAVVLFMAVYYGRSGLIADGMLCFSMLMVMAGMAAFGATLTLPGIAGIVLTLSLIHICLSGCLRSLFRNPRRVALDACTPVGSVFAARLTVFGVRAF